MTTWSIRAAGLAACSVLAWPASAAQLPEFELLIDLELSASNLAPTSSSPIHLAASGPDHLFSLKLPVTGRELFLSDGTAGGTRALQDLTPTDDGTDPDEALTLPDGRFLVAASRDDVGKELFVVDPAQDSITLLADLLAGPLGSEPKELVLWNGLAWFLADGGTNGRQLWRTDGTISGTTGAMNQTVPGGFGSGAQLHVSTGPLYIADQALQQVYALPTPGTFLSPLISQPASGTLSTSQVATVQDRLVFGYLDPLTGLEPWSSDGTPSGTGLLVDFTPGSASSFFDLESNGSHLWIRQQAFSPSLFGTELFVSDGTSAGTSSLAFIPKSTLGKDDRGTTNGLFFTWWTPSGGFEPWFSDGSPAGTAALGDLVPGSLPSSPRAPVEFGGAIYFAADTPAGGNGLYRTDGTAAGTGLVEEYGVFGSLESATPLGANAQHLFLRVEDALFGTEPGALALGASAVASLGNFAPDSLNAPSDPRDWIEAGDLAYFSADVEGVGRELWGTDGSPAGTSLVADIWPGPNGSLPTPLTALGDRLLFLANDSASYQSLWITDGTAAGTNFVSDFGVPGSFPSFEVATELDGRAAIVLNLPAVGPSIWITDGTPAGTSELSVPASVYLEAPVSFAGEFWFIAYDAIAGNELWRSDGTPGGTQLATDFVPGPGGSGVRDLVVSGDRLYASATDGLGNWSVYRIEPGGAFESLGNFQVPVDSPQPFGERGLVFASSSGSIAASEPNQLWVTDGSPGNLVLLDGFLLGSVKIQEFQVAGDRIFFWASGLVTFTDDSTLWVSSGVPGSEVKLGTASSQSKSSFSSADTMQPVGSDDRVLLFTEDVLNLGSPVVFLADASAGSFELLGLLNGGARYGARVGDRILLKGDDGVLGSEPYTLSVSALGGYVAEPYGKGCGASIGSEGEVRIGSTFEITLEADPVAPSGLFLSLDRAWNPLGAECLGLLGPVVAGYTATTDTSGSAAVSLAVPGQLALVGVATFWQWASLSLAGPFNGAAKLSGGLEVVIGS